MQSISVCLSLCLDGVVRYHYLSVSPEWYTSLPVYTEWFDASEYLYGSLHCSYQPPFEASCAIIPGLNGTCVEVYKFFADGSAVMLESVSLHQYDTYRYFASYMVKPDGSRDLTSYEDMTGYYVNSTKPVQVLCGHECAWVPTSSVPFCDHMVEQIPPVAQLGTYHIVPPINGRSASVGYVVRVVATKSNTTVTWKSATLGVRSEILPLAGFKEIITTQTVQPMEVTCSQPCVVMQYNKGIIQYYTNNAKQYKCACP